MHSPKPRILMRLAYAEAAQQFLRSLPPEHFMEATAQATQREITLESLALVRARRPDVQVFNELLVQYPRPRTDKPGQVVPDNMIVIHPEPSHAEGSFDVPFEAGSPFCVLEYVSNSNKRKDYDDNMHKYERELKVPYYLLFYPDGRELTLYHHNKRRYVSVKPNEDDRLAIPELDMEVALLEGWVRYWYLGDFLALPAQLQSELDEAKRRLAVAQRELDISKSQLVSTNNQLISTNNRLVAANTQRDDAKTKLSAERRAREAAEKELARLRTQLGQKRRNNGKEM